MSEAPETPAVSQETYLKPGELLRHCLRWARRWAIIGFVLGAVGMCWIALPYTELEAQLIIKGLLGAMVGSLVGAIGGVFTGLSSRPSRPRTWITGAAVVALAAGGLVGLFWVHFARLS